MVTSPICLYHKVNCHLFQWCSHWQLCQFNPSVGGSFLTLLTHPAFLAPSLHIGRITCPIKPATNVCQCLYDTKVSAELVVVKLLSISFRSCLGVTSCWMRWLVPGLGLHWQNRLPFFTSRDSHCTHRVLTDFVCPSTPPTLVSFHLFLSNVGGSG